MLRNNGKITGILMLAVGVVLLVWPGATLYSFCRVLGWCLVIGGAAEIIMGVTGTRSPKNTAGGAVSAIVGIVLISHPGIVIAILPFLIGLAVAAAGAGLLIRVIAGRVFGTLATMQIIGGVITLVLGLILMFHPVTAVKLLMVILGIVLIYYGILVLGRS